MPDRFRVPDEVPDHQEVARELHVLDHLDFAIQTLRVLGEIVLQHALRLHRLQARPPLLETLPRDVLEIRVGRVLRRERRSAGTAP